MQQLSNAYTVKEALYRAVDRGLLTVDIQRILPVMQNAFF
jgi:hypothetical protein